MTVLSSENRWSSEGLKPPVTVVMCTSVWVSVCSVHVRLCSVHVRSRVYMCGSVRLRVYVCVYVGGLKICQNMVPPLIFN